MIYLKFCECISSFVVHVFHGADNAVSWQAGRTHVDPPTDYPDRPLPGVKPSPLINLLAIYLGPTVLTCFYAFPQTFRHSCVSNKDVLAHVLYTLTVSGKRVGTTLFFRLLIVQ